MNTNNNYYLYRGEDAPKNKEALWLHHSLYKDLSSPIVLDIYSQGKWQSVNASGSAIKGTGISTVCEMTQAEYEVLTEKDSSTIYITKTTVNSNDNEEVTGYKLYKGSILIADSNLPNEIEQLLASI